MSGGCVVFDKAPGLSSSPLRNTDNHPAGSFKLSVFLSLKRLLLSPELVNKPSCQCQRLDMRSPGRQRGGSLRGKAVCKANQPQKKQTEPGGKTFLAAASWGDFFFFLSPTLQQFRAMGGLKE